MFSQTYDIQENVLRFTGKKIKKIIKNTVSFNILSKQMVLFAKFVVKKH